MAKRTDQRSAHISHSRVLAHNRLRITEPSNNRPLQLLLSGDVTDKAAQFSSRQRVAYTSTGELWLHTVTCGKVLLDQSFLAHR